MDTVVPNSKFGNFKSPGCVCVCERERVVARGRKYSAQMNSGGVDVEPLADLFSARRTLNLRDDDVQTETGRIRRDLGSR